MPATENFVSQKGVESVSQLKMVRHLLFVSSNLAISNWNTRFEQ